LWFCFRNVKTDNLRERSDLKQTQSYREGADLKATTQTEKSENYLRASTVASNKNDYSLCRVLILFLESLQRDINNISTSTVGWSNTLFLFAFKRTQLFGKTPKW